MFGKKQKKESSLYSSLDDSRSIAYDFLLRSPYDSYRCMEYRLYHKLEEDEMLPLLDEHLEKLFAGEVDAGNSDMLDALIFSACREAAPDLMRQRYDHGDMLRRLIARRKSDHADIRRIREDREKERDSLQAEYEKLVLLRSKLEEV